MRISSLSIAGFRNLQKTTLEFDAERPTVALIGSNGQGKTNILESLFLLGISKSFRTDENQEMVGFGEDFCSLRGTVERKDETLVAEVIVTRKPPKKTLKLNGGAKKASDYIGNVGIVFFSPDDLGMIHRSPNLRRRYLDLLLSQIDRSYLEDALTYQSALKQRNILLRRIGDGESREDELEFWDHGLSEIGSRIARRRSQILAKIESSAETAYQKATGGQDQLTLEYLPSCPKTLEAADYFDQLFRTHSRDLALGATQSGPHRDDLRFLVNGHDLASFGSRGEWRSLVLTLKFAEIGLLSETYGEPPILLLDDVFSELDENRQKTLFNMIRDCQTFLTTTHREFLDMIEAEKQVFRVENGVVSSD